MTDTELKLALAKMLPEVVRLVCSNDRYHWTHPPYETVRDTELLHLVSLAETKLEEWTLEYVENLKRRTYEDSPHGISYDDYNAKGLEWCGDVFATWQQRTLALCKTKGIEP